MLKEKVKTVTGLKIAMIGHKRIPSREGGVEIVVEELASRLAALGHSVTVFNRKGHHISGEEFGEAKTDARITFYKGIRIETVATINGKGLAAVSASFFATLKALSRHYDVIHYHAEGPCLMLFLPRLFGIHTVATIHGLDWQRNKWGSFASKCIKLGERIAAKYGDELIVLSKNVKQYFLNQYGRETTYIANGIQKPIDKAPDTIRRLWGLEKNGYILYLGRIVPEKGIHYLLRAFMQLKTDKRLVIAGGSSDTDNYLQDLKKLASADNRILFTGFVQGQALEELYSNAYVYVLPSDLEGMPISLLEALSYGNCCVVSDIPECTEVVEAHAVIFEKGNVEDLTGKLTMLLENPVIVQGFRKEAAAFVCSKYDWDYTVCQTALLYKT
jgi:glycosyltransferase involved in cell wall biosynthesis